MQMTNKTMNNKQSLKPKHWMQKVEEREIMSMSVFHRYWRKTLVSGPINMGVALMLLILITQFINQSK